MYKEGDWYTLEFASVDLILHSLGKQFPAPLANALKDEE